MTKEQRVVGESGTRTWRGRQGQARQGLEDHVGKVGLYLKAKRNGRVANKEKEGEVRWGGESEREREREQTSFGCTATPWLCKAINSLFS